MDRARFDELMARYEDGLATRVELEELGMALKANADYRRELVHRNRIEVGLHELSAAQATVNRPSVRIAAVRHTRKRRRQELGGSLRSAGIAAAVFLAAGALLWVATSSKKDLDVIARVAVAQDARLIRAEKSESIQIDEPLTDGNSVATGSTGRAEIVYPDGTRVTLAANATVVLNDELGAKRLRLSNGEISASVAKQPVGKPMIFATTYAHATVLGTQLKLASHDKNTRLDVTEGAVRLQKDDGHSVEVSTGRFAVAEPGVEMTVKSIAPEIAVAPPVAEKKTVLPQLGTALLKENFDDNRMEGWENGRLVPGGPTGSRFAYQANTPVKADIETGLTFTAVLLPLSRVPSGNRDHQYIFQYQPGIALRFAYFVEGDVSQLRVQGFNTDLDDNFGTNVETPVRGEWAIAQVRFDAFEHNDPLRCAEKIRPGDHFKNLSFFVVKHGATVKTFMLDDILVAPELGTPPQTSK